MIELETKYDDIQSQQRPIQHGQVDAMSWRGTERVAELVGCGRLNGREKSCASFLLYKKSYPDYYNYLLGLFVKCP